MLDQLKEACEGEVLKELHFLNSDEDVVRSYQLPAGLQAAASDLRDFCSAAVVARKAGAPGFFASAPVEAGGKKGLSGAFPK